MLTEASTATLLTAAAMRDAEAHAIASGVSSWDMMQRAGNGVGELILRSYEARPVRVMCGPGNNGGDGYVAATFLRNAGWEVEVGSTVDPQKLAGDARRAFEEWGGVTIPLWDLAIEQDALYIDAIFGTGLDRPLEGKIAAFLEKLAEARVLMVAVDIVSGVNADTGLYSNILPSAAFTVTFGARKPGHLLLPGTALAGLLACIDIGIGEFVEEAGQALQLKENRPEGWMSLLRWPAMSDHKYTRGSLVVQSGPLFMTGASRLAARAALRAGVGAVTIACNREALPIHAAQLSAVMTSPSETPEAFAELVGLGKHTGILVGPGAGISDHTRACVQAALATGKPTVLDADALTSFETNPDILFNMIKGPAVMTPHDGELQRLFAGRPLNLDQAKWLVAREAAQASGMVVVLKGFDTVIAAPDGRVAINFNGTPVLATAGSGDVLAGIIASLCAQGMPAYEAACAGVSLHAEAGQKFGVGLIAEDIPDMLPGLFNDLLRL
jgi:NAD(P)H-hydrate epimerase